MRSATITTKSYGANGQFGELVSDRGFKVATGELPWKDDKPDVSSLPGGDGYVCRKRYSPNHGRDIYHIDGDHNRSNPEIHSGNFCGDVFEGFVSQVLGCVIVGWAVVKFPSGTKYAKDAPPLPADQMGVTGSVAALAALEEHFGGEDFALKIIRQ